MKTNINIEKLTDKEIQVIFNNPQRARELLIQSGKNDWGLLKNVIIIWITAMLTFLSTYYLNKFTFSDEIKKISYQQEIINDQKTIGDQINILNKLTSFKKNESLIKELDELYNYNKGILKNVGFQDDGSLTDETLLQFKIAALNYLISLSQHKMKMQQEFESIQNSIPLNFEIQEVLSDNFDLEFPYDSTKTIKLKKLLNDQIKSNIEGYRKKVDNIR